jgi:hypothetical protein
VTSETSTGEYAYTPPSPTCGGASANTTLTGNLSVSATGNDLVTISAANGLFTMNLQLSMNQSSLGAGSEVCFSALESGDGGTGDGGAGDADAADVHAGDSGRGDGGRRDADRSNGTTADAGDADAGDDGGGVCGPCVPLTGSLTMSTFSTDCPPSSSVDEGCLLNIVGTLRATARPPGGAFSVTVQLNHQEAWASVGPCAND